MGAQESSQANLLSLMSNANLQTLDFNRIGDLAKLVSGHEHEVFSFLTELMMSSSSQSTSSILTRVHKLQDWDQIKKLLPVIIQWVSKNKIDASMLKNIDADDLVKKLTRFIKNPDQQQALQTLLTSFQKQLVTPPDLD